MTIKPRSQEKLKQNKNINIITHNFKILVCQEISKLQDLIWSNPKIDPVAQVVQVVAITKRKKALLELNQQVFLDKLGQTGLTNQPGFSGQTGYGQQGLSSQQNYSQPGMMPNQGMTGTQFAPNQGISGQGLTGQSQYPVNQYGQIPPAKTLAKNQAKVGFIEKMKQKVFHHDQKQ